MTSKRALLRPHLSLSQLASTKHKQQGALRQIDLLDKPCSILQESRYHVKYKMPWDRSIQQNIQQRKNWIENSNKGLTSTEFLTNKAIDLKTYAPQKSLKNMGNSHVWIPTIALNILIYITYPSRNISDHITNAALREVSAIHKTTYLSNAIWMYMCCCRKLHLGLQ